MHVYMHRNILKAYIKMLICLPLVEEIIAYLYILICAQRSCIISIFLSSKSSLGIKSDFPSKVI